MPEKLGLFTRQRLLERLSCHDSGPGNGIGDFDPLLRRWLDVCSFRQRADALTNAQLIPEALIAARRPDGRCTQQKGLGPLRVDEFEHVKELASDRRTGRRRHGFFGEHRQEGDNLLVLETLGVGGSLSLADCRTFPREISKSLPPLQRKFPFSGDLARRLKSKTTA